MSSAVGSLPLHTRGWTADGRSCVLSRGRGGASVVRGHARSKWFVDLPQCAPHERESDPWHGWVPVRAARARRLLCDARWLAKKKKEKRT